jgi:hypothetical protein
MVPSGLWAAVRALTKRPVRVERFTARLFLVPRPSRSVVVRPGCRATVAFDTNLPVEALR